jgi:hypothetical protein
MPDEAPILPWDQQDGELAHWYARFEEYRRQGPQRSLEAVWKAEQAAQPESQRSQAKRPPSGWYEASKQWQWRERAEAWDRQQRADQRAQDAIDREAMRRRHAAIGMRLQAAGVERLETLDAAEEITAHGAIAFLTSGVSMERQARGEPDVVIAQEHEDDAEQTRLERLRSTPVAQLSDAELVELILGARSSQELAAIWHIVGRLDQAYDLSKDRCRGEELSPEELDAVIAAGQSVGLFRDGLAPAQAPDQSGHDEGGGI